MIIVSQEFTQISDRIKALLVKNAELVRDQPEGYLQLVRDNSREIQSQKVKRKLIRAPHYEVLKLRKDLTNFDFSAHTYIISNNRAKDIVVCKIHFKKERDFVEKAKLLADLWMYKDLEELEAIAIRQITLERRAHPDYYSILPLLVWARKALKYAVISSLPHMKFKVH